MVTRTKATAAKTVTAPKIAAKTVPAARPTDFNPQANLTFDYNEKTGELVITTNLKAGYALSSKGNKMFAQHGFSTKKMPEGLDDMMINLVVMERPAPKPKAVKAGPKTKTGAVISTKIAKPATGKAVIPAESVAIKKPAAKVAPAKKLPGNAIRVGGTKPTATPAKITVVPKKKAVPATRRAA